MRTEKVLANYKQIEMATISDCYTYLSDDSDPSSLEWGCKWIFLKECISDYNSELRKEAIELALKVSDSFILSIPLSIKDTTYIVFKNGIEIYKCTDEIPIDYVIRKKLK